MQVNGPAAAAGGVQPARLARKGKSEDAAVAPSADTGAPEEKKLRPANGVLRLLQEGHFKGVADVRLRINFADEIAALQGDASAKVTEAGPGAVLDPLDKILQGYLGQDGLDETLKGQVEDAATAFADAVKGLFDGFDPKADPKGEGLIKDIQDAFKAYIDSLTALLEPEDSEATETVTVTPEETTESVVPAETETPNTISLGDFIDQLSEAFQKAIEDLQKSFTDAQVLPELSGPTGNGGAYAKFLEILNGLAGAAGADAGGVDTAA